MSASSEMQMPKTPDSEFARLLAAARSGSRAALGQLVEQYRPYLLWVANDQWENDLRSKKAPSDAVQETLLAAQRDLGQFRGQSPQEWMGWLKGILLHEVQRTRRDYRRVAKRQVDREQPLHGDSQADLPRLEVHDPRPSPLGTALARETATHLAEAIQRLPEEYREVLRLRNWEQLTFEQAGEQLGRSAEATRKLWTRAILRLRRELKISDSTSLPSSG